MGEVFCLSSARDVSPCLSVFAFSQNEDIHVMDNQTVCAHGHLPAGKLVLFLFASLRLIVE